ncbi:MAG: hypothetical protein NVSMB4_19310 [Acidimicrobiales bacterium]
MMTARSSLAEGLRRLGWEIGRVLATLLIGAVLLAAAIVAVVGVVALLRP